VQTKANRFMACLTIGVCLGSILAVVTTLLASKWFYLIDVQVNNHYLTCYYLTFFAALTYTFSRGASRSAIHILYALSIACLFIPLTTLLTIALPSLALWEQEPFPSFIFEFVTLVFAAAFYYGALKTKHRAYYGEPNSIWALPVIKVSEDLADKALSSA